MTFARVIASRGPVVDDVDEGLLTAETGRPVYTAAVDRRRPKRFPRLKRSLHQAIVSVSPSSGRLVSLPSTSSRLPLVLIAVSKLSSVALGKSLTGVTVTVTVAVLSLPGVAVVDGVGEGLGAVEVGSRLIGDRRPIDNAQQSALGSVAPAEVIVSVVSGSARIVGEHVWRTVGPAVLSDGEAVRRLTRDRDRDLRPVMAFPRCPSLTHVVEGLFDR